MAKMARNRTRRRRCPMVVCSYPGQRLNTPRPSGWADHTAKLACFPRALRELATQAPTRDKSKPLAALRHSRAPSTDNENGRRHAAPPISSSALHSIAIALKCRYRCCASQSIKRLDSAPKMQAGGYITGLQCAFIKAPSALFEIGKTRNAVAANFHGLAPARSQGVSFPVIIASDAARRIKPLRIIAAGIVATALAACAPPARQPHGPADIEMIRRGSLDWSIRCAWAEGRFRRPLIEAQRNCHLSLGVRPGAEGPK